MFDSLLEEEERNSLPPRAGILSTWQLPLAVCAVLPTIATTYSAKTIINVFQGMALAGSGGIGAFSMGMYEASYPLAAALGLTAVLILGIAITQLYAGAHKLSLFGTALCVVGVAIGVASPLLLWSAESFSIRVVAGDAIDRGVAETSVHLSRLLIASALGGLIGPAVGVPGAIMALVRPPRSSVRASRLVPIAWLFVAAAFAALACAFYSRSAMLHDAAMTGSLRPAA